MQPRCFEGMEENVPVFKVLLHVIRDGKGGVRGLKVYTLCTF